MEPEKEKLHSYEQMAIVEKFEVVISYLYPIAHNLMHWMEVRYGIACG